MQVCICNYRLMICRYAYVIRLMICRYARNSFVFQLSLSHYRPAFQYFVLPIVNYCSPVWSPILIFNFTTTERVQRRYNKRIRGPVTMCYTDRLQPLETLIVHRYRYYLDMITVYKCLHSLINCIP